MSEWSFTWQMHLLSVRRVSLHLRRLRLSKSRRCEQTFLRSQTIQLQAEAPLERSPVRDIVERPQGKAAQRGSSKVLEQEDARAQRKDGPERKVWFFVHVLVGIMITQGNHSRVKVGRSHNPHTRAQQLSAGHPELIVVFHVWPCRGPLERFVHDRFAPLNVQNGGPGREWFNVNSDMAVTLIDLLVSVIDTVDALVMQST